MSDPNETAVGHGRHRWVLRGIALAAALAIAVPAWAQSAEDLNAAELGRLTTAAPPRPAMAMTVAPQAAPQPVAPPAGYVQPGYAATAPRIDCNNPYYAQYCQAYAAWLNRYYAPYDYGYAEPYDDYGYYDYGYPVDVGFGVGFFRGHRFHDFHHAFFHGGRFHGGFHGGGFHGGGFHGGGFHGGGGHH